MATTVNNPTESSGGTLGTRKTLIIMVTVVGCIAILWPKVFYPMMTGPGQTKPVIKDHRGPGCCDVVLDQETFANTSINVPNQHSLFRKRIVGPVAEDISIRQERPPHLRPETIHPAMRERGRAIPQVGSIHSDRPSSPPRIVEGRPGPIPGMRPPMGAGSHQPTKSANSMGFIMPLYTIGIVSFFIYTILKLVFKKTPPTPYPEIKPDSTFRNEVFTEPYIKRPESGNTKLGQPIINADNGVPASTVQAEISGDYEKLVSKPDRPATTDADVVQQERNAQALEKNYNEEVITNDDFVQLSNDPTTEQVVDGFVVRNDEERTVHQYFEQEVLSEVEDKLNEAAEAAAVKLVEKVIEQAEASIYQPEEVEIPSQSMDTVEEPHATQSTEDSNYSVTDSIPEHTEILQTQNESYIETGVLQTSEVDSVSEVNQEGNDVVDILPTGEEPETESATSTVHITNETGFKTKDSDDGSVTLDSRIKEIEVQQIEKPTQEIEISKHPEEQVSEIVKVLPVEICTEILEIRKSVDDELTEIEGPSEVLITAQSDEETVIKQIAAHLDDTTFEQLDPSAVNESLEQIIVEPRAEELDEESPTQLEETMSKQTDIALSTEVCETGPIVSQSVSLEHSVESSDVENQTSIASQENEDFSKNFTDVEQLKNESGPVANVEHSTVQESVGKPDSKNQIETESCQTADLELASTTDNLKSLIICETDSETILDAEECAIQTIAANMNETIVKQAEEETLIAYDMVNEILEQAEEIVNEQIPDEAFELPTFDPVTQKLVDGQVVNRYDFENTGGTDGESSNVVKPLIEQAVDKKSLKIDIIESNESLDDIPSKDDLVQEIIQVYEQPCETTQALDEESTVQLEETVGEHMDASMPEEQAVLLSETPERCIESSDSDIQASLVSQENDDTQINYTQISESNVVDQLKLESGSIDDVEHLEIDESEKHSKEESSHVSTAICESTTNRLEDSIVCEIELETTPDAEECAIKTIAATMEDSIAKDEEIRVVTEELVNEILEQAEEIVNEKVSEENFELPTFDLATEILVDGQVVNRIDSESTDTVDGKPSTIVESLSEQFVDKPASTTVSEIETSSSLNDALLQDEFVHQTGQVDDEPLEGAQEQSEVSVSDEISNAVSNVAVVCDAIVESINWPLEEISQPTELITSSLHEVTNIIDSTENTASESVIPLELDDTENISVITESHTKKRVSFVLGPSEDSEESSCSPEDEKMSLDLADKTAPNLSEEQSVSFQEISDKSIEIESQIVEKNEDMSSTQEEDVTDLIDEQTNIGKTSPTIADSEQEPLELDDKIIPRDDYETVERSDSSEHVDASKDETSPQDFEIKDTAMNLVNEEIIIATQEHITEQPSASLITAEMIQASLDNQPKIPFEEPFITVAEISECTEQLSSDDVDIKLEDVGAALKNDQPNKSDDPVEVEIEFKVEETLITVDSNIKNIPDTVPETAPIIENVLEITVDNSTQSSNFVSADEPENSFSSAVPLVEQTVISKESEAQPDIADPSRDELDTLSETLITTEDLNDSSSNEPVIYNGDEASVEVVVMSDVSGEEKQPVYAYRQSEGSSERGPTIEEVADDSVTASVECKTSEEHIVTVEVDKMDSSELISEVSDEATTATASAESASSVTVVPLLDVISENQEDVQPIESKGEVIPEATSSTQETEETDNAETADTITEPNGHIIKTPTEKPNSSQRPNSDDDASKVEKQLETGAVPKKRETSVDRGTMKVIPMEKKAKYETGRQQTSRPATPVQSVTLDATHHEADTAESKCILLDTPPVSKVVVADSDHSIETLDASHKHSEDAPFDLNLIVVFESVSNLNQGSSLELNVLLGSEPTTIVHPSAATRVASPTREVVLSGKMKLSLVKLDDNEKKSNDVIVTEVHEGAEKKKDSSQKTSSQNQE
ncbi:uncharacterized protein LOC131439437 [Malaya genurostris]|uniref:uncharacterized protein LOC131439437 n=1 Tax=Malaya genurostris TaxID=325434 RepID=UPI0026F3EE18|nr:uncharacterized protein LOC131439437 [Malaya genurostris]